MYSTIASLHIALDTRLQLLNSNRKQMVHPQQYDMAINDAILQIVKTKVAASVNRARPGLEETVGRYMDLDSIKRRSPIFIYNDNVNQLSNENYKFDLPHDCYRPISLTGSVLFNKNKLTYLDDSTLQKRIDIIKLPNVISGGTITINTINPTRSTIINVGDIAKSSRSLFYAINYIRYILDGLGIKSYVNDYDGIRKENSIICVGYEDINRVVSVVGATLETTTKSITVKNVKQFDEGSIVPKYVIYHNRKVELVSSDIYDSIRVDSLATKNMHLHPIYKLIDSFGYIICNDKFKISTGVLEYIKHPILVNSDKNIMTDLTITDEILDVATTNLSVILKTGNYEQNKLQEQNNT